jgi:hypothetical protein
MTQGYCLLYRVMTVASMFVRTVLHCDDIKIVRTEKIFRIRSLLNYNQSHHSLPLFSYLQIYMKK